MGATKEEYFPRGSSSSKTPALRKIKVSLFKKYKKPKKKNKKTKTNVHLQEMESKNKKDANTSKQQSGTKSMIKPLTYQNLEEGMVVVGRIREIGQYHIFVCLPGRLSAKVSMAAVSKPYTENLKKLQNLQITSKECPPLNEIFRVGQAVVCCVMEKKRDGDLLAVAVSLEPALVNAARAHYTLHAGHIIVAAVSSEEDYGYTLHTGVNGLTTFLARDNAQRYVESINGGRPLAVGEVLRCLVKKCVTGKSSSRVEVTVDPAAVAQATLSDISSQTLQPGSTVQCVVQQRLKHGLVVNVGQIQGYIEKSQLGQCWTQPDDYKTETKLKASVLYTLPQSDFQLATTPVYLTLKNIHVCVTPRMALGNVVDSLVSSTCPKGIFLCLGEKTDNKMGNKGFVSIRRLGEDIRIENIAKKFPKGNRVTARILAFDYMEQVYNCSLERNTLQQQCVSVEELKVGDRVTCQVTFVEEKCLKLALGSIKLVAFQEHSADIPYTNLYQNFAIGDVVDGRVLHVSPELRQVTVTLKETLIRSPMLADYQTALINGSYWGTVRHVRANSLLVTFYNNVTGTVQLHDHEQMYTPGQLVKCYVTYVNAQEEKMLLSLTPSQSKKPKQLLVGEVYELVVTEVFPKHFAVSACDYDGIDGIVYKCHQYDRIFSEGDFMKAWLYQMKGGVYHFSPDPAIQQFIKCPLSWGPRFRLTCLVEKLTCKKIKVRTPLEDIPTTSISRKMWPGSEQLELHQIIRAAVSHVDFSNNILILTKNFHSSEEADKKDEMADDEIEKCENTELDHYEKTIKKEDSHKPAKIVQNESESLSTQNVKKRKQDDSKSEICNERDEVKSKKKKLEKQKYEERELNDSATVISQEPSCDDRNSLSPKKTLIKTATISKENNTEQPDLNKNYEDLPSKRRSKSLQKPNLSVNVEVESHKVKNISQNNTALHHSSDEGNDESLSPKIKMKYSKKTHILQENLKNNFEVSDQESIFELKNKIDTKSKIDENELLEVDMNQKKIKDKRKKSDKNHNILNGCSLNKDQEKNVSYNEIENKNTKKVKTDEGKLKQEEPKKLTLSETGFLWDVKPEDLIKPVEEAEEEDVEGAEESGQGKKKKKTAAEKRRAAKEEEARLREVERKLMGSDTDPQSVDQYDRAVLARPDDADLWIKYMTHHLQATEIEKARAVARRALQNINQRLETERLNVWIALLNLENLFGTQESLRSVLDEALRTNDEFTVYTKMLKIYSEANKSQETEQLVHKMLRKLRNSSDCWLHCCSALMKVGLTEKARNLLHRAITNLPTREHVNLLIKFALLENQYGFKEQAKTLFEQVLTSYPKRTDVWSVYIDMLIKSDQIDFARQVLEQASKKKLPARKMKVIFTKWISIEEKYGTPQNVESIRNQALAYLNDITTKLE